MKRCGLAIAVLMLVLSALVVVSATAKGPKNAGDGETFTRPNWASFLYIGIDYGAGWTATATADGAVIEPIGSPGAPATVLAKGRYFSDPSDPDFSEKDWVRYKFWLEEPVKVVLANDEEVYATRFIVIECDLAAGEYSLKSYK